MDGTDYEERLSRARDRLAVSDSADQRPLVDAEPWQQLDVVLSAIRAGVCTCDFGCLFEAAAMAESLRDRLRKAGVSARTPAAQN